MINKSYSRTKEDKKQVIYQRKISWDCKPSHDRAWEKVVESGLQGGWLAVNQNRKVGGWSKTGRNPGDGVP